MASRDRISTPRTLFISHRHADKKIADVLRNWIEHTTMGRVKTYQSSQPGQGPRPGYILTEELRRQLQAASVVLCIFTVHDHDWSYCMWECGLATDPVDETTRVIILQFSERFPAPFQDRVRVDVRERTAVEAFVTAFLTDPDFFSGSDGALAPDLASSGSVVKEKADQLFTELEKLRPEATAEWRAWPVLILEFSAEAIAQLDTPEPEPDRLKRVEHMLMTDCLVVDAQRTAPNLFGFGHFPQRTEFHRIVDAWKGRYYDSPSTWISSLARQISLAVMDLLPATNWEVMEGGSGAASQWSIPVLCWTRRDKSRGWVQFDIYFIPVRELDPTTGRPELGYGPRDPAQLGPLSPQAPSEEQSRWIEEHG